MYSSQEELDREEMRRLDAAIRQEGRKPQPIVLPPHEHFYQYFVSDTIVVRGCACGEAAFIWKLNNREGWAEIWTKIEEEMR